MIQAVTVSLNYGDFLQETLPLLAKRVDKIAVVTSLDDKKTLEVAAGCPKAEAVITDAFWRDGATFRKGAAINAGLAVLEQKDWILHVDADVVLLNEIPIRQLREDTLYGARRKLVKGRTKWLQLLHRSGGGEVAPQDIPFTGRRNNRPIGFFQLWHASQWRAYPEQSPDASTDDIIFADSFELRSILTTLNLYHLEVTDHRLRANWKGRVTREF